MDPEAILAQIMGKTQNKTPYPSGPAGAAMMAREDGMPLRMGDNHAGKQGGGPTNPVPEDTIEGSILENTYDDEEAAVALMEAMSQADPKTIADALAAFAEGNSNGGIGASPADLLAILQQGGPVGDKMAQKQGGAVPAEIMQLLLGDEMAQ